MTTIIGVRFRKTGKVFYFDPTGYEIDKGDKVIVETIRGVEYGTVALPPKEMEDDKIPQPLKPLIRKATEEDAETNAENERLEKEALTICHEKIRKHGLEMKLIDSEYTFDRNKLLFYFTADGRIDFRELVKDLASVFRTRIELRQIGVRDETKLMGGIAICGRPLCCHSYLSDFVPVSIKMAKEQNLSLNPSKISGVCGRLMCCLKNEEEAYEYLNKKLPYVGSTVTTADGYHGLVQSVNVLKQLVKVLINKDNDEKEVKEYPVAELKFRRKKNNDTTSVAAPLPDEDIDENDLRELEKMEQNDLEDMAEETSNNLQGSEHTKAAKKTYNHNNYYHGKNNDNNLRYRNSSQNGQNGDSQNNNYRENSYNQNNNYKDNGYNQNSNYKDSGYNQNNNYKDNSYNQNSNYKDNGYNQNSNYKDNGYNQNSNYKDSGYNQNNNYKDNGYNQNNNYRGNGYSRNNNYRGNSYSQNNNYRDNNYNQNNGYNGNTRNGYHTNQKGDNQGGFRNENRTSNKSDENRSGGNYREHSRKENRRHYNNNTRRRG